jgi:hypothetical protein
MIIIILIALVIVYFSDEYSIIYRSLRKLPHVIGVLSVLWGFYNGHKKFLIHKRNVSHKQKKYIASRQRWKCKKCKKLLDETYEIDHIIPLYNGGSNKNFNLQALCPNCHRKKSFFEI